MHHLFLSGQGICATTARQVSSQWAGVTGAITGLLLLRNVIVVGVWQGRTEASAAQHGAEVVYNILIAVRVLLLGIPSANEISSVEGLMLIAGLWVVGLALLPRDASTPTKAESVHRTGLGILITFWVVIGMGHIHLALQQCCAPDAFHFAARAGHVHSWKR